MAFALHAEVKAAGYGGGCSAVTDFVRAWRQGEGQAVNVTAFVPLNFELGEAFQFDWSEEGLVFGGKRADGSIGQSVIDTVNGCICSPLTAVEAARRVVGDKSFAGFYAPARLFGDDFAKSIPGDAINDQ